MRVLKAIFSVLTIVFGSLGLINIVSTDITLPLMFVFMGLTFLTSAKECYDKGAKKDAIDICRCSNFCLCSHCILID